MVAQDTDSSVVQIQPTIIIMPQTKSGENALTLYESDPSKWQAVIDRIKYALQKRHFEPIDLQDQIEQVKRDNSLTSLADAKINVAEAIYASARADFIIKCRIDIHKETDGAISVSVSMDCIEASSRKSKATFPMKTSPSFKNPNIGFIVDRLLKENNAVESFINDIDKAFKRIIKNGKEITFEIFLQTESQFKLTDEVGDDYETIKDLLVVWIKKNAYKNISKPLQSNGNKSLRYSINIPLRDEYGNNYDINDFQKSLEIALAKICTKQLGSRVSRPHGTWIEGTLQIPMP